MVGEIGHGGGLSVALGARQIHDDFLRLVVRFFFDGAVGMQELVGDVGEDGGAARPDAAFGHLNKETGEELADVDAGGEFGKLGEEVRREIGRVIGGCREGDEDWMEMSRTEARLRF